MFLFVEYIVEQEVWDRRFGLETTSQIIVLFLKLKKQKENGKWKMLGKHPEGMGHLQTESNTKCTHSISQFIKKKKHIAFYHIISTY